MLNQFRGLHLSVREFVNNVLTLNFPFTVDDLLLALMLLVQQPCHEGDAPVVVPGCLTGVLQEGLGGPHVVSEVCVRGEHGTVPGRLGALHSKAQAKADPSGVKPVELKPGRGSFIAGIILANNHGKSLLLAQFNLH